MKHHLFGDGVFFGNFKFSRAFVLFPAGDFTSVTLSETVVVLVAGCPAQLVDLCVEYLLGRCRARTRRSALWVRTCRSG